MAAQDDATLRRPHPAIIVRGMLATWQDAVGEAHAVKRHAVEVERAGARHPDGPGGGVNVRRRGR
jgi:hypothetical protein